MQDIEAALWMGFNPENVHNYGCKRRNIRTFEPLKPLKIEHF